MPASLTPGSARTAARADKPLRPAQPRQVVETVGVRPEPGLELAKRARIVLSGFQSGDARILVRLDGYPQSLLSCGQFVLVDKAAEHVPSAYVARAHWCRA